jgi:hypothetical protein
MDLKDSPFVPGARVAIRYGHSDNYTESFVDKVYKTGRFTLRGAPKQQWRPSTWRDFGDDAKTTWVAYKTNDRWSRSMLKIWDATTDTEISAALAAQARLERFDKVRTKIGRLRTSEVTDGFLTKLELAFKELET